MRRPNITAVCVAFLAGLAGFRKVRLAMPPRGRYSSTPWQLRVPRVVLTDGFSNRAGGSLTRGLLFRFEPPDHGIAGEPPVQNSEF